VKQTHKLVLRLHQREALEATKVCYDRGLRRLLIQLPTGVGKTPTFAALRDFFGFKKRVLVLVHRDNLAKQAADKLRSWNPGCKVGIEMGTNYSLPDDDFVVASVPTLSFEGSPRLLKFNPDDFDAVICDEAHHAIADSWRTVLGYFGFFDEEPSERLLLGVTATPNRGDKKGLGSVFQELSYKYPLEDAVREGWLAEPRGYSVRTTTSLDSLKVSRDGELPENALASLVDNPVRNALIVKAYKEMAFGRQFVAFTVNIAHAKNLAKEFNRQGVITSAIWGIDKDREAKQAAHQELEIVGLTNCDVLTEGYDDWRVGCIINGAPTNSQLKFTQRIGRGTRIQPDISNLIEARMAGVFLLKEDCIVIDVVDATTKLSLASLPSIFGLPINLDLKGASIIRAMDVVQSHASSHPDIDYSALLNLDDIGVHAERVDLFKVSSPDRVVRVSVGQWYKTPGGSYMLRLPDGIEYLEVFKDLTDHWTAKGTVRGNHFVRGGFTEPETGIVFADGMLAMLGRGLIRNLKRTAKVKVKVDKMLASSVAWIFIKNLASEEDFALIPKNLAAAEVGVLIQDLMHKNVKRARQRATGRARDSR
jgi:superfamily II DNA or RNA helicase